MTTKKMNTGAPKANAYESLMNKLASALSKEENARFATADIVKRMKDSKAYEKADEQFKTFTEWAESKPLGLSKGSIIDYINVANIKPTIVERLERMTGTDKSSSMQFTNLIKLHKLLKNAEDVNKRLDSFEKYVLAHLESDTKDAYGNKTAIEIIACHISKRELVALIKDYMTLHDGKTPKASAKETAPTKASEDTKAGAVEIKIIVTDKDGNEYAVPVDILKQYELTK